MTGVQLVAGAYLVVVALAALQPVLLGVPAGRTWGGAWPYLAGAAVVAAGVVLGAGRGDRAGRRWLAGIVAVLVVTAAWATVAFARALPVGLGDPSGFYRVKVLVTTPLGDHNTVAGVLLVGVVAAVVLAQEDRRWWAAVTVTALGLTACLSRGAALVLLAAGLVGLLAGVRRRVAVTVAGLGLAATVATLAIAGALGASPPAGADVPDGPIGTSVVGRVDLAVRGVELTLAHPTAGVGLGGFAASAGDLPVPNDHAHSGLPHAGAEGGVPLLVAVAVLWIVLVVGALRAPPGWRRDVLVVAVAALLGHAQADVLTGRSGPELVLGALLALVVRGGTTPTRRLGSRARRSTGRP